MQPVVYIDILFIVNLFINYVLLWTTAQLSRIKARGWRIWLGSALGALYAVCMFFPRLQLGYTLAAKIIFSLALIAISYDIHNPKLYCKALALFYLINFAFGGGAMALFFFTNVGSKLGAVLSNGIFYFNLPWQFLAISVGVSYVVVRLVWRLFQNRLSRDNMYVNVIIGFDGMSARLNALLDTGNSLHDPISQNPVVVAEYSGLAELLPDEINEIFRTKGENDLTRLGEVMSNSSWTGRFRLIPFSSLGRENGMLIGFKPDFVTIIENESANALNNVVIGIYNSRLAMDGSYTALLHPEVIANK